jgi:hypothetical protein
LEECGVEKVAVKIQGPLIESKLLGDIANLKAIRIPQNKQPGEGSPDDTSPEDLTCYPGGKKPKLYIANTRCGSIVQYFQR